MLKEYFIAIILGALLGFGVTGGYYSIRSRPQKTVHPDQPIVVTPTPNKSEPVQPESSPPPPQTNFVIQSPENYSIVSTSKIDLSGTTTPQSTIVISTPVDSYVTQSNSSGDFSQKIDLESGFNIIQITAVDPQENQTDLELIITYSTAKI